MRSNLANYDVLRYDGDSVMYLGFNRDDEHVYVLNGYDYTVSAAFVPPAHAEQISIENAPFVLSRYIQDPAKRYGEWAGLWDAGSL